MYIISHFNTCFAFWTYEVNKDHIWWNWKKLTFAHDLICECCFWTFIRAEYYSQLFDPSVTILLSLNLNAVNLKLMLLGRKKCMINHFSYVIKWLYSFSNDWVAHCFSFNAQRCLTVWQTVEMHWSDHYNLRVWKNCSNAVKHQKRLYAVCLIQYLFLCNYICHGKTANNHLAWVLKILIFTSCFFLFLPLMLPVSFEDTYFKS